MSSGIYIHFPFCKSKCSYCAFFSHTSHEHEQNYYSALFSHVHDSLALCRVDTPSTLYFGGGTPSLMDIDVVAEIINCYTDFDIEEITMEMNPGDVTEELLERVVSAGVNRISLGVQALEDTVLDYLGRRHTFAEAQRAVSLVEKHITNYSIDFIIGIPGHSCDFYRIEMFLSQLKCRHVSLYGLSVEPGTTFFQNGVRTDDEQFAEEYLRMSDMLTSLGYTHYEVSNFAKNGFQSRHNSKYWLGENYIGLGPSAHSLWNGKRFCFHDDFYTCSIAQKCSTTQGMTLEEIQEEHVMLSLRTNRGTPLCSVKHFAKLQRFIDENFLTVDANRLYFTPKGWTMFDALYTELF